MVTVQELLSVELKVPDLSVRDIEIWRCRMDADHIGNFIVHICDQYERMRHAGGTREWSNVLADEGRYLAKGFRSAAQKRNIQLVLADAKADIARVLLEIYSKMTPLGVLEGKVLHAVEVRIDITYDGQVVIFTLGVQR